MNNYTAIASGPRTNTLGTTVEKMPILPRVRIIEDAARNLSDKLSNLINRMNGVGVDPSNTQPSMPGITGCLDRTDDALKNALDSAERLASMLGE